MTAAGDRAAPATGGGEGASLPLRLADGAVAALDVSGRVVAALCLSAMFLALLVNVALRYAFGDGIAWAYEIHALLLPWLVAGGVVIAAAKGRNIAVTLSLHALPPGGARALLVLIHLAVAAICISVLVSSPPILKAAQYQRLSTLGVTQVWGYVSLVYAFAAMALIAAINAGRALAGQADRGAAPEDASFS